MKGTLWFIATCLIVSGQWATVGHAADLPGIPPEVVADYLHAVIEADRTVYTIHVVERMEKQGGPASSEHWRRDKATLPLPVQVLQEANALATLTGTKVRYRLISLWPINPQNAPANDAERMRLESVRQHPELAVTDRVTIGEQPYFQAVYADRAVTQACVKCHNAHPLSPKKDFNVGDVIGGLVIEMPLKQE